MLVGLRSPIDVSFVWYDDIVSDDWERVYGSNFKYL